jgi:hypothetical protein
MPSPRLFSARQFVKKVITFMSGFRLQPRIREKEKLVYSTDYAISLVRGQRSAAINVCSVAATNNNVQVA